MDWQLTCRVCLETGDMVSLFDWDENNEQLGDKYTYCCGVEVTKNDSLPTLICLNCVDRLTFAFQFKQQCLSSNDTLKECLEEFMRSSAAVTASSSKKTVTETETISIKQENGLLLQYELPVEHDPQIQWTRTLTKTPNNAVVTKAPKPRSRGRPRKYPNKQGQIDVSPYQRKKQKEPQKEQESLTSLLASGSLDLKQEPGEDEEPFDSADFAGGDDPDFEPDEEAESDGGLKKEVTTPRKRGRPRKVVAEKAGEVDDGEDMLLKETIMAFSEPIPDHILNPKPRQKYASKKRYVYEKTHTCETCGSSFTSNASLQAHIRRHLGIKPFVCSVCGYSCVLNMELRRHMMRHTGQRPYKCRVCDRRFGDFGSRQKHERPVHHLLTVMGRCRCSRLFNVLIPFEQPTTPYQNPVKNSPKACMGTQCNEGKKCSFKYLSLTLCPDSVCGYSCVMKEALKRHMLRHTGERPYKCRICDRRFGDFGTRQKHERLHMGVRPYQCSLCGKAFTYSYVLANHMLTHTGEKKYACEPCNKKFTKAHHLKYHNKVHHQELYIQQQLELEAKKIRQQINVSGLSGVLSGQIVDGALQLIQTNEEDGEQELQMHVVEEADPEDSEAKETDRAVAGMQAVVLDSEFSMEEDDKTQ
ncbi:zinc finger and BTB domain-containing protein 17-like isoform X1 [Cydia pomonella]|uniref:zinc finger and BTB domain-containing protein 17-like isoform X1 n=1 Tax=Cydia pomonella TaxID=82600 RepID=UPI002ADE24DA|nr:zinc finger and BTB domain-containing protein 17-like isoform X1 [Cydia pomonella]